MEPHEIFRWVPRERRAEYAKMMRGTYAVAYRDLGRAWRQLLRELETALSELVCILIGHKSRGICPRCERRTG